MRYRIKFKKSAKKELDKLPRKTGQKILKDILSLAEEPRPLGYTQLNDFEMQSLSYNKLYRMRSGNYRVIYAIEEEIITITILKVGHRKDIYRKK